MSEFAITIGGDGDYLINTNKLLDPGYARTFRVSQYIQDKIAITPL
jgi:hypothetical protein